MTAKKIVQEYIQMPIDQEKDDKQELYPFGRVVSLVRQFVRYRAEADYLGMEIEIQQDVTGRQLPMHNLEGKFMECSDLSSYHDGLSTSASLIK